MESILRSFAQAWRGFNSLALSKKLTILTVAGITLLSIVMLVHYVNKAEYRVLFSNLSTEDAGSIVAMLQEKKVPYELSPAGNTISVPSDKVSELRLEMAASGLPRGGGVGFEIFDKKALGVTEFVQRLNYQRALQGELARTISGLDEIQQCRVHIVMPKKSLFVEEQEKPTASVIIKLRRVRGLRESQIEGITCLVASSVEGLSPEDVTVVDNRGNVLSRVEPVSEVARMTGSQIEYQRNVEKNLSDRIRSMLEKVVGKGNAAVRVSAAIDFRVMEKTEELYDPEEPVVRSMQRQSEKTGGPTVTGESTVSPTGRGATGAVGHERVEETVNYEINRVVSKTIMPVGEIEELSIAVLVDGIYTKDQKGTLVYQKRPKKEVAVLEDLVKKAAGFDSKRGDQVVVTCIPFEKVDGEIPIEEKTWLDKIMVFAPLLKYVAIFAAFILIVIFVIRPIITMLAAKGMEAGVSMRGLPPGVTTPGLEGEPPPLAIEEPEIKKFTETEMVKQMVESNSGGVAQLLRNWL